MSFVFFLRSRQRAAGSGAGDMGRTLGQFRVHVNASLIPGQPVRAGTGVAGAEFLVRVPDAAEPGDSFVFTVTEEDVDASVGEDLAAAGAHVIEAVVLEKKKTAAERIRGVLPQLRAELDSQVLVDVYRTTFLAVVFACSMVFGFVGGILFTTWGYWDHAGSANAG